MSLLLAVKVWALPDAWEDSPHACPLLEES